MSIITDPDNPTEHNGYVFTDENYDGTPTNNETINKWINDQLNGTGSYETYKFLITTADFLQHELGGGSSGEENPHYNQFVDENGGEYN